MLAFDSIGQDGLAEAPSTGTTTNQIVSATLTTAVSLIKSVGAFRSSTLTSTVSLVRGVAHVVSLTCSTTGSVIKDCSKIASVGLTTTVSIIKALAFSVITNGLRTLAFFGDFSRRNVGGGLGSGHFSKGEWHRILLRRSERAAAERRAQERALALKRKKEREARAAKQAALASRLSEIDAAARLAQRQGLVTQALHMQGVMQSLAAQMSQQQMMALRARQAEQQEEEDVMALLASLD